MDANVTIKNSPDFVKLGAAFYTLTIEKGLTPNQLQSLVSKMPDCPEFELMTVEGESLTAMGIIDIHWFKNALDYEVDELDDFVSCVIDGDYEAQEDHLYELSGSPVYIANPDVY